MAGKVAQPPVPPTTGLTVGEESTLSASLVNSFRVIAVVDRLALHLQPGRESNSSEFFGLCLSLARGIDYAVANNEFPSKVQDLPLLLKQVCRRKNDPLLEAAIMVLMISVKNACKVGWFSDQETQELISLSSEIGNSFRSFGDTLDAAGSSHSVVSTVISRYYPKMKMGEILVSLEVKPGFGAYVQDFHISKKSNHSPHEKIRLFVAQTDGIDTSACIISPQQVNFLLNGKGVDKRTNIQLDTGPQLPTNVTGMLKYGTNLLQAVGTFHGNYVIIVAFMSTLQLPDPPVLLDYVQSSSTLSDPAYFSRTLYLVLDSDAKFIFMNLDSDIIEGPSRISLNCPISFSRIKTPIKGSLCKHLQCFDFGNYVEINSKRPSWRCPHCNQNVSYADIRIDQNIFKVLKEVGENITHVNISADGSWKAVMETDDNEAQAAAQQRETPEHLESSNAESPATPMILDLTEGDDLMDELLSNCDTEERKPAQASFLGQSLRHLDDHSASQMGDWAQAFFPTTTMTSPVITDATSPALNMDSSAQFAPLANEYTTGMRHVGVPASRVPTAIQALPATFLHHQTPRMSSSVNNVNSSGGLSSVSSDLAPLPTANGYTADPLQRFSRSHPTLPRIPGLASAMLRQTPVQSVNHEARYGNGMSPRSTVGLTSGTLPGGQRCSLSPTPPLRMPLPASLPSTARTPSPLSRASTFQAAQAGSSVPRPHARPVLVSPQQQAAAAAAAASAAARMMPTRQPPVVPIQMQSTRTPYTAAAAATPSAEQSWRPTGKMRGSLQGRDIAELRSLLHTTQQASAGGGTPSSSTLSEATIAPHLRGLFEK